VPEGRGIAVTDLTERRVTEFLAPLERIEPVALRRGPRKRTRGRVALAFAAIGAAVVVALVLPGDRRSGSAAAAVVLEDVARVAARQPLIVRSPGYTYSKTLSKSRITFQREPPVSVTFFQTDEVWLASDGSGRTTTRYGRIVSPSARARAEWELHDKALVPSDRRFTLRSKFRDVNRLPRDPDRLLAMIRAEAERASSGKRGVAPYESLDHMMWARLSTLLGAMHSETNRRPRLRAAIFRAFAKIEGARLLGRMLDPLGRAGIGVAFAIEGMRDVIVFDPRTSRLLAFKTVVTDPSRHRHYYDVKADSAASWTAFYPPARVRSLGEVPPTR
jgi:hypothetical protein